MRSLSIAAIVRKLSCTPNDSSFKLEPGLDRVLSGLKTNSLLKLGLAHPAYCTLLVADAAYSY